MKFIALLLLSVASIFCMPNPAKTSKTAPKNATLYQNSEQNFYLAKSLSHNKCPSKQIFIDGKGCSKVSLPIPKLSQNFDVFIPTDWVDDKGPSGKVMAGDCIPTVHKKCGGNGNINVINPNDLSSPVACTIVLAPQFQVCNTLARNPKGPYYFYYDDVPPSSAPVPEPAFLF